MMQLNEATEYCKQFEGVTIHGKRIRINFYYQGVRCIETLRGIVITKTNIKFAYNKRVAILHEIQNNQFDYLSHFPESRRAALFSTVKRIPTIAEIMKDWLILSANKNRPKTVKNQQYRIDKYIVPKFGSKQLNELTQSDVKKWISLDLSHLANKTINQILIPFRGAFDNAMADRVIDFNPFDYIKNLRLEMTSNANPFTLEQIGRMRKISTPKESERNAILFACFSGLRISEYLSLAWEDVDLVKKEVNVRRSVVEGAYYHTKTDGSYRTVQLLDQAHEILLAQRAISQRLAVKPYEVMKQNNRTSEKQNLRMVFVNSITQSAWRGSESFNTFFFGHFLDLCKIPHRGPNQCRHTFASQLIMKGVAERWIAKQLGHKSTVMLEKHYAKWMDEELPDMAGKVSKLFLVDPIEIQKNTGIL